MVDFQTRVHGKCTIRTWHTLYRYYRFHVLDRTVMDVSRQDFDGRKDECYCTCTAAKLVQVLVPGFVTILTNPISYSNLYSQHIMMRSESVLSRKGCLFSLIVLACSWTDICFALVAPGSTRVNNYCNNKYTCFKYVPVTLTSLWMQDNDGDSEVGPETTNNEEGNGAIETPTTEEDPEVVALKEEIAKLESELKSKKSSLSYVLDQVEEYSKSGYARAVAEMENMRRVRSVSATWCSFFVGIYLANSSHSILSSPSVSSKNMNTSSKTSALAGVLRDFLPVYDRTDFLKEKYMNNEFGSKYGGLSIGPTFTKVGVKEFSVMEGAPVDLIRMHVVGSEYSEALKDTVIRQVSPGMELEGNVIRAAKCITSLGKEADASQSQNDDDGNAGSSSSE